MRAMLYRQSRAFAWVPYEKDGLPPHPSELVRAACRMVRRAKRYVRHQPPATRLYADYEEYLRTDLRPWIESCCSVDVRWLGPGSIQRPFAHYGIVI